MNHPAFRGAVSRDMLVEWFRRERARSAEVFAIPVDGAYYERPIPLRNPIVFYEGHLPAFSINTLIKLALHERGIDESFEVLFARGIDPDSEDAAKSPTDVWPSRADVQAYGATADEMIERALRNCPIDDALAPQRVNGEAALTILEHEQMHQETLLYMFHQLPYAKKVKRAPLNAHAPNTQRPTPNTPIHVPAGTATIGATRGTFGWDNEFPAHRVDVDAFTIDALSVTNGDYLEYMTATGAAAPHFWTREPLTPAPLPAPRGEGTWFWRGMFELIPLPLDWPAWVTHDEADAYARWKGKRLPSEAEYHRAAFGTPSGEERLHPWGDEDPDATRGNFDFTNWDPVAAGSYPAGASAWGIHDLVGNGWEWTSTVFDGFDGFEPMPSYAQYSADFFDGQHYVMKGASPVTAKQLVRRTFRNWFRPNYPYVFAKFRCVV